MTEPIRYDRTDLTGTDFSEVDLSGQSLAHSTITGCKFGNCEDVSFVCSHGENVDFNGANISGTSFEKADESVLFSLVGAKWHGVEITAVSGWLVTEGYWAFATNAFVQCGCMVRTIKDWCRICESMETIAELLQDQPDLDLAGAMDWWQKNSAVLIECSADFAGRE